MELHASAVRHRPTSAQAWHALGVTLHRYGYFDFARQCYDFALKINRKMHVSRLARAMALAVVGQVGEAREDWSWLIGHDSGTLVSRAQFCLKHLEERPSDIGAIVNSEAMLRAIPYET
jgi:hypothetical protein